MVTGKLTQHMQPAGIPRAALPTMYDLPSEDPEESGLPDMFHDYQPHLLHETFQSLTYPPDEVLTAADLNLYYDVQHHLWHKRPDWFAVLSPAKLHEEHELRLSYVMWHEQVAPYLVVELLSPGTEDEDLGRTQRTPEQPPTKWMVYEQILGVPYYVVFSRYTNKMRCFVLDNQQYRDITPVNQSLWLPEAGLGLGLWFGAYERSERWWLRFYDANEVWIPTRQERIEHEHQRAEHEHQRAERLAARLQALGIDPEE